MERKLSKKAAKAAIKASVLKGAALLDVRHPRWYQQIDLDYFDLSSGQFCICGQLDAVKRGHAPSSAMGSWSGGLKRLFGRHVDVSKFNSRDETHGFCVSNENAQPFMYDKKSGWELAEGFWKTEIVKRRRAAKLAGRAIA